MALRYLNLFFRLLLGLTSVTATCSPNDWATLNHTVSGNLHRAAPLSLPCFSTYNALPHTPNPQACAELQSNYISAAYRSQFYAGFSNNQDEICASNTTDQCLLNNLSPTDSSAWTNKSCNQGSVSEYYIEVHSVGHVRAAFEFSRRTGVSLSIKNSGHDYLARSSLKGSLALWVRKWGGLSRDVKFVPDGCCGVEPVDTITTGAGVNFDEAYRFADKEGVLLIGGYSATVGITGGWVQGGGHSVLSPVYGLGIDRVVQFKIVTPDGVLETANACQNADLFWALRGGGGGTFGVVVEATHRVEKPPKLVSAVIRYQQTQDNVGEWFEILVNGSLQWGKEGWGGHLLANNLINVTPLLGLEEAKTSMEAVSAFALRNNGTAVFEVFDTWFEFYSKYVTANEATVGSSRILATRLIPASLFTTSEGRARILGFMNHMLSIGFSPYIPVTTPYLYPWDPASTSATSAWRGSLWSLSFGANWKWNSTLAAKDSVIELQQELTAMVEDMTPGGGGYLNEAMPWTKDWREAWWGEANYARLSAIKKKFDPEALLGCWKCVGWEEEDAEKEFPCFAGIGG